jgi:hypothetical protein
VATGANSYWHQQLLATLPTPAHDNPPLHDPLPIHDLLPVRYTLPLQDTTKSEEEKMRIKTFMQVALHVQLTLIQVPLHVRQ